MKSQISVGFPRMRKEPGEKRVFLPDFIQMLTRFADVFLSEGYGSRLGFSFDDFRQGNPRVFQTDQKDAFQKDYVIMLRSPNNDEFELIKRGACLISMLHYPTRPQRVKILNELGINSISLDSIVDDHNLRLVENMRAVAWNGLEVAFDLLEKTEPGLQRDNGSPFRILVLGTGMIGKHAVEAATKLGNIERNARQIETNGPGSIALSLGRNLSQNSEVMEALLRQADVLGRRDPTPQSQPAGHSQRLAGLAAGRVRSSSIWPSTRICWTTCRRLSEASKGYPRATWTNTCSCPADPEWDKTVPASIPSEQSPDDSHMLFMAGYSPGNLYGSLCAAR